MKNVLLITNSSQKYYFDPFVAACDKKNLNIFVFDPSSFPIRSSINIRIDSTGQIDGFIDVLRYKIGAESTEKVRLPILDINIAWHLRGNLTCKPKCKSSMEQRFAKNESIGALRSLFSVLKCTWINRQEIVDFLTSNKLYQQMIAIQSGLLVPNTLVSNDPESIVCFSNNKGLLLKTIGYVKLDKNGKCFLYSQKFSHKDLVKLPEAIRSCPVFSQEYVEKRYEYRVMVIGNQVLSCRIDSQASKKTKIDWRHYDFDKVEHKQIDLPQEVRQNLLLFMKKIGLQYGAIDLIETPDGKFVFLEVNPSGQWGWIADLAGLPIPEAVAEMLESI